MASPVAASTFLDFTSSDIGVGATSGSVNGVGFTITSFGGALTNATHWNDVGCNVGYAFACTEGDNGFDVGFGVQGGGNGNEIDEISGAEYVQVAFDRVMKILGFAGMLTYNDSQSTGGTERVELQYSTDGVTFSSVFGVTQNDDNDPNATGDDFFGTVGLSYASGLAINARYLRFKADDAHPFDDGNANVTAAGLDIAPVPLPAALPLLLAGMGMFGWAARRKKRMAA